MPARCPHASLDIQIKRSVIKTRILKPQLATKGSSHVEQESNGNYGPGISVRMDAHTMAGLYRDPTHLETGARHYVRAFRMHARFLPLLPSEAAVATTKRTPTLSGGSLLYCRYRQISDVEALFSGSISHNHFFGGHVVFQSRSCVEAACGRQNLADIFFPHTA